MTTTTPTRPTRWRWLKRAAAILGLSTLVAGGGLREDEIECEQTVSYLQGCCPDFAGASVACNSVTGCGSSVDPALSIEESECILALSCAQIVATGLCERVKNLASPSSNTWDDTSTNHAPVCP